MSTEEKITSIPETSKHPKPKRLFKIDKKHIQGFVAGVLVSAIVFTGLLAGYNPSFLTGSSYYISTKTVADIDTIYYLQGDSTKLEYANNKAQKIKFIPTGKQYGFEDIDIIVEGSVGDKYSLVFGVSSSDSPAKMTLVGASKYNPYIEWIPLTSIEWIPSSENGDFYRSNERGVVISVKKSGVKTFVSPIQFSQTAGVIIEFKNIGKTDIYSVFNILLTGTDGSIKNYKVLCHNIRIES
ncbi:MAG: hypothetical protein GX587_09395 [Bacteroidales bacterium]|nr:hypothetical protein [Bacteroidales bacterium]